MIKRVIMLCILPCASVNATVHYASPGDNLQAKLAALAEGDTLYFNEGTYNWNNAMRFGPGYTVVPASAAGTITLKAAPDAVSRPHIRCTTSGENIVDMNDTRYYQFEDLEFSGGSAGFKMYNSSYVTIRNCYVHDTGGPAINLKLNTHHITVEGCEIARPGGTGECFYVGSSSDEANHQVHHCLIDGNLIHGTLGTSQGDGVELKYMTYANVVRNNVIYDVGYPGIFVYGHSTRTSEAELNIIEGNVIFDTSTHGMQIYGQAVARNNIIFNTGGRGIEVRRDNRPVGQVRLVNNTLWNCNGNASDASVVLANLSDASGVVIENNCVYAGTAYALALNPFNTPPHVSTRFYANLWRSNGHGKPVFINKSGTSEYSAAEFRQWLTDNGYAAADPNSSDADPLFVNAAAWNFYPGESSPLRDMGTANYSPSTDFDGVLRDANPDCGAYEWTSSGGPLWNIGTTFKGTAVGPEDPPPGGGKGGCGGASGAPGGADSGAFFWIFTASLLYLVRLIFRASGKSGQRRTSAHGCASGSDT
ncbi:MAG TPA: right-handed parallel beta-helix repeat-containing protein [Planctomycetes bacterium]|nr:right-handed parallel beta-helix repeat-containing protein [Planctomycetota bacterium]